MDHVPPTGDAPVSLAEPVTAERLLKSLTESGLYGADEVQALALRLTPALKTSGKALAHELVRQQKLTVYQANQLLLGRSRGLVMGNYVIQERIGQGGMGMVFKARHKKMGREVALKVLPPQITKSPQAAQRFQREAQAAAKLNHPNIVAAFDFDEAFGAHFLVMEYVEGCDLSRLVKQKGPLPVDQAVECILQAARGLEHAHASGIVHRDIKPSNLLLAKSQGPQPLAVKVLDLGLARIESNDTATKELTQTGSIMGTCDYMSPEQALNPKNADHRSDVYSLGCTLYYLLTGQVMYGGDTAMEKLLAHREAAIPALRARRKEVPEAVEKVYRRMVAKSAEERFGSMKAVIAALEACQKGGKTGAAQNLIARLPGFGPVAVNYTEVESQDATPQYPYRKQGKSKGRLVLALSAGAVVLAGVVVFALSRSPSTDAPARPTVVAGPSPVRTTSRYPDDAWLQSVRGLQGQPLVDAIAQRLKELNRGFDGNLTPTLEKGKLAELAFSTEMVSDIAPLRALAGTGIRRLNITGGKGRGLLVDIGPLRDLGIKEMSLAANPGLTDLGPLAGNPLESLTITNTGVESLKPLRGMPLRNFNCMFTPVRELEPLQGMKISNLFCGGTKITDLSPIRDLPLAELGIQQTPLTSLAPLRGTGIRSLQCDFVPTRDLEVIESMPNLQKVNHEAVEDLKKKYKKQ